MPSTRRLLDLRLGLFGALLAVAACGGSTGPNGNGDGNGDGGDFSIIQGSQASLNINESVQLSVTGADGVVQWSSDDPSVVSVAAGLITALAPGQARITAINRGRSASIVVTVTNRVPVADAGDDQALQVGELATLDGSRSSDPDGQALSYSWSFLSRPSNSTAELANADTDSPSFTPDVGGDYQIQLVVSDGFDDSAPDDAVVTGLFSACAASDRTVNLGTVFTSSGARDRTFALENTGNQALSFDIGLSAGSSAAFSIVSGGGDVDVAPEATHEVTVRFRPTDDHPGLQTGTVQTGGSPCGTVSVRGIGGVTWTKVTQLMASVSPQSCYDCHGDEDTASPEPSAPRLTHAYVSGFLIDVNDPADSRFLTYPVNGSMFGGVVIDGWKPGTSTYDLVFHWIAQGGQDN